MAGLTRFDFFRMFLPGAIGLFIFDIVLRVVTPETDSVSTLAKVLRTMEDPLTGLALAFALGLCLYFIDFPYAAPQFFEDIPSTHLRSKLIADGLSGRDSLSLFFRASDGKMPEQMRERALLYGAIYRVGLHLVVFSLGAAGMIPALVLAAGEPSYAGVHGGIDILALLGSAAAVPIVLPFARWGLRKKRPPGPERVPLLFLGLPTLFVCLLWLNYAHDYWSEWADHPRWFLFAHGVLVSAWLFFRIMGPPDVRIAHWRGESKTHPDSPFRPITYAALDGLLAVGALTGLVLVSGELDTAQLTASAALLVAGLLLAFNRKYERQLRGIYRNQNYWIDAEFDNIKTLLP